MVKCHVCGIEKDPSVKEFYPYEEDNIVTDRPTSPVCSIDVEGYDGYDRRATICNECWHRLCVMDAVDLWLSEKIWETLNPVTPFNQLPNPENP